MNKKVIAILVVGGLGMVFLSFGVRNLVVQRNTRLSAQAGLEEMELLVNLAEGHEAKKDYVKAKEALKQIVDRFPDSEEAGPAAQKIESLNIKILFSNVGTDDSSLYEIQQGDTLSKIASQFGTTVELIKESNNLDNDLILPGRRLKVNKAKFNIVVDKNTNTLMLQKAGGETVKTYVVSTGKDFSTPVGTFKIEEKLVRPLWYKVGAVVEPDSSEYELGLRWMGLSIDGYGIHGTKSASSIGKYITKGCVRMKNEDVVELYNIVPEGTEVTIHE